MTRSNTFIDALFDGRYRIRRRIGSGGRADVYLAEDEDLGRRVAIKILNDRYSGDESFIGRFQREAESAAGLSHPNIVSIYDRGDAEGTYYIAMEYLETPGAGTQLWRDKLIASHLTAQQMRDTLAALANVTSERTGWTWSGAASGAQLTFRTTSTSFAAWWRR